MSSTIISTLSDFPMTIRTVHGKLLSFFSDAEKNDNKGVEKNISLAQTTLAIQITPMGWHLTGSDPAGKVNADSWHSPVWQENPVKGVEQSIRELILRHGSGLLESVDTLSILLELPGIHHIDGKNRLLTTQDRSPAALRLMGADLLNVPEVTYGSMIFGQARGESKHPDVIFSYADSQVIRGILSLFDKLGLKISTITPLPLLLLPRAMSHSQPVYGGLCLGELECTIVLFNRPLGSLTVRSLPLGMVTLAHAMASGNAISLEEAFQALADPDLLVGIHPLESATSQSGFLEQALLPPLQQLLTGIQETLDYFGVHRACGFPMAMDVMGNDQLIAGLIPWLQQHLRLPLESIAATPLEIYLAHPTPFPCNLLSGAEHSLLSVGRTKYYYSQEGFVRHKLSSSQDLPPLDLPMPEKNNPLTPPATSWFQRLLARISPTEKKIGEHHPEPSAVTPLAGGVLLLVFVVCWAIMQAYSLVEKHQINVKSYLAESSDNDQLRRLFKGQTRSENGDGNRKFLWGEKFLAITDHLDPYIWLSDLYLDQEKRTVAKGEQVTTLKLVIKGKVLPSRDGYMKRITTFMDNLLQDKAGFMNGFRTIQFMGAEEEANLQGPMARFTLEAWYDKNLQLVPLSTPAGELSAIGQDNRLGLSEMQQNVNQYNRALEQSLTGGERKP